MVFHSKDRLLALFTITRPLDKHTSLLVLVVSDKEKNVFIRLTPAGTNVIKLFTAVSYSFS